MSPDANVSVHTKRRPASYVNSDTRHPYPWLRVAPRGRFPHLPFEYDPVVRANWKRRPPFEFGNYIDNYYYGPIDADPVPRKAPESKLYRAQNDSRKKDEKSLRNVNRFAALDSGTTSNFMPATFVGDKPGPPPEDGGPAVECANGSTMPTVGTDVLSLKGLPMGARRCLKLKNLQLPLVSVKQLCFYGMKIVFQGDSVAVCGPTGNLVLEGTCGP